MNFHPGLLRFLLPERPGNTELDTEAVRGTAGGHGEIVFRGRQLEGKTLAEVELQAAADLQVERVRGVFPPKMSADRRLERRGKTGPSPSRPETYTAAR